MFTKLLRNKKINLAGISDGRKLIYTAPRKLKFEDPNIIKNIYDKGLNAYVLVYNQDVVNLYSPFKTNGTEDGDGDYVTSIILPTTVETINDLCFRGCYSLEELTFTSDVVKVGAEAFEGCENLKTVYGFSSVTDLGDYAFQNSGIETIELSENLSKLGEKTFNNSKIKDIVIPKFDISDEYCFENCKDLTKVTLSSNVTLIPQYCFNGCTSLKYITFPETKVELSSYCFARCGLTNLDIICNWLPIHAFSWSDLWRISLKDTDDQYHISGPSPFYHCTSLRYVDLWSDCSNISDQMFCECSSLRRINLPPSIESIGSWAFKDCTSLKIVDCSRLTKVPTLIASAFEGTPSDMKIIVPDLLYDEWVASDNWVGFSSQIVKGSDIFGVYMQNIDDKLYTLEEWVNNGMSNCRGIVVIDERCAFTIPIANYYSKKAAWSNSSIYFDDSDAIHANTAETAMIDYCGEYNNKCINDAPYASIGGFDPDYLPALGELKVAFDHKADIDSALSIIGKDSMLESWRYWSSTQCSKISAWTLNWSTGKIETAPISMENGRHHFRPLTSTTFYKFDN